MAPTKRAARPLLWYFRCNQPGHRAAECPATALLVKAGTPGKVVSSPWKAPDKSRVAYQAEVPAIAPEDEEVMTAVKYQLVAHNSEDEGPEDPMVSKPIHPFIIPVTITGPQSGWRRRYGALIDFLACWGGFTQCSTVVG